MIVAVVIVTVVYVGHVRVDVRQPCVLMRMRVWVKRLCRMFMCMVRVVVAVFVIVASLRVRVRVFVTRVHHGENAPCGNEQRHDMAGFQRVTKRRPCDDSPGEGCRREHQLPSAPRRCHVPRGSTV